MSITIITSPCCWGVNDVTNPNLPPWHLVMREAAKAGYCGLELGPHGYMPLDVVLMSEAVGVLGLPIVAGTIFDDLVSAGNRNNLLRQADEICSLISRLPNQPSCQGNTSPPPISRSSTGDMTSATTPPGIPTAHPASRTLSGKLWSTTSVPSPSSHATVTVCAPWSTRTPEATSSMPTRSSASLRDIPQDTAGLCLDTGHCYYSGMDPVAALERYAARLDYIHFRDIDLAIYRRAMRERIRFFDACALGAMCPIGRGIIDYPAIRALLDRIGYEGFISVEHEGDPLEASRNLADVTASRGYLKGIGF